MQDYVDDNRTEKKLFFPTTRKKEVSVPVGTRREENVDVDFKLSTFH